jgi:hypothetical protein
MHLYRLGIDVLCLWKWSFNKLSIFISGFQYCIYAWMQFFSTSTGNDVSHFAVRWSMRKPMFILEEIYS